MALTAAQRLRMQQILLRELDERRETQPLLLIDSIIDGTIRQKVKTLLTQTRAELQTRHDGIDAGVAASKAAINDAIAEIDAAVGEIPA